MHSKLLSNPFVIAPDFEEKASGDRNWRAYPRRAMGSGTIMFFSLVTPCLACILLLLALDVAAQESGVGVSSEQQLRVIETPPEVLTRQKLPNFVGISRETAGARGLSMNLVVIPPGAAAEPHLHKGFESAVYVLEGRVETRYGPRLEHSVVTEAGDFLFIPPDLPHQPVNLSETEAARAIVAQHLSVFIPPFIKGG
jgi:uncharacterized RmlC-like cupin family protein